MPTKTKKKPNRPYAVHRYKVKLKPPAQRNQNPRIQREWGVQTSRRNFTFDDGTSALLDRLADGMHMSYSQVIQQALEAYASISEDFIPHIKSNP